MASASDHSPAFEPAGDVNATIDQTMHEATGTQPTDNIQGDEKVASTPTRSSSDRASHDEEKPTPATADSAAQPAGDGSAVKHEDEAKYERPRAKVLLIMFALGVCAALLY